MTGKDIARATGPLSKAKIYIDDTAGISVMEMRSKCRRIKNGTWNWFDM